MITAVDTNVLLDVFGADPSFGARSRESLRAARTQGAVAACEVVWSEACAWFPSAAQAEDAMARLRISFSPMDQRAALAAGVAWAAYRVAGGRRDRVIADFLIGAHAELQADRLLTRDRGFYRTSFSGLTILDPSTA
jgi:predicted nucleic acid-binding protein